MAVRRWGRENQARDRAVGVIIERFHAETTTMQTAGSEYGAELAKLVVPRCRKEPKAEVV